MIGFKVTEGMRTTALFVLLSACTSQAQIDHAPIARAFTIDDNYQSVYARLNKIMRSCDWSELNSQLYPDLGYGEVVSMAGDSPLDVAKISKSGTSALVELKSIRKAVVPEAAAHAIGWMEYWAKGGETCQGVFIGPAPSS